MFSGGFEKRKKVLPGFEPGSENSKSSVITDYTIGPLLTTSSLDYLKRERVVDSNVLEW